MRASCLVRTAVSRNRRRKPISHTLPITTRIRTKEVGKITVMVSEGQIPTKMIRKANWSLSMTDNHSRALDQGSRPQEKPKREGWSYNRKFTPLDQSLETVLEYMLGNDMIKLPRVADPPAVMGKMKDRFCKFHRTVGHDTENCFVLKNIIHDYIDKNLLVEGAEDEKMEILNQPFFQHSTAVISDNPFQSQDHIQPCPSSDIDVQHQVLVLHKVQSNSQRDGPCFCSSTSWKFQRNLPEYLQR